VKKTRDLRIWFQYGCWSLQNWMGKQNLRSPIRKPWRKLARFVRTGAGGRSHRCEFTDPKMGALYGHREGAFMDRLFDQLLTNISVKESSSLNRE
jgi:hypothetical protein